MAFISRPERKNHANRANNASADDAAGKKIHTRGQLMTGLILVRLSVHEDMALGTPHAVMPLWIVTSWG